MMANYNRSFDVSEFDPLLEKYRELCEIRREVELLTGEVSHQRILESIRSRKRSEDQYRCPPHLYLGLTPKKQEVVIDSWDNEIRNLRSQDLRQESLMHLISEMKDKESIEDVRAYLKERKNMGLFRKTEKTFNRLNR